MSLKQCVSVSVVELASGDSANGGATPSSFITEEFIKTKVFTKPCFLYIFGSPKQTLKEENKSFLNSLRW